MLRRVSIHFQGAIIWILGATLREKDPAHSDVMPIGERKATVRELLTDAEVYLETALRLYYFRHGFEELDSWLVQPLLALMFMHRKTITPELPAPEIDAIRSSSILCAEGLHQQGRNFYLAQVLLHVIRSGMAPEEVVILDRFVPYEFDFRNTIINQGTSSVWPVNVMTITEDPETKALSKLVGEVIKVPSDANSEFD
jgi:hypothetical protein